MDKAEKAERKEIVSEVNALIDEGRVVAFSDAVFAFAATLLVLKIDLPVLSGVPIDTALPKALMELWPQYLANIISFLIIGFYWLNHHAIFGMIKHFNRTLVWLNIIFLIVISLLPFPVDLYGDYSTSRVVVAFYSGTLCACGLFLAAIWMYASSNNRLIDKGMSKKHIKYYTWQFTVAPVVFAVAVPLAYIHPLIAQFSWIFVILGLFLVDKMFNFKKMSEIEMIAAG